jgi:hypothetical protein
MSRRRVGAKLPKADRGCSLRAVGPRPGARIPARKKHRAEPRGDILYLLGVWRKPQLGEHEVFQVAERVVSYLLEARRPLELRRLPLVNSAFKVAVLQELTPKPDRHPSI